jgi:hypothetical protein
VKTREQHANKRTKHKAVREEQARIRHAALEHIREQIRAIKTRRVELAARVRSQCKTSRARAREAIAVRRREGREQLNRELVEMRTAERNRCALRRQRVKFETLSALERKRHELDEERRGQAFVRRTEVHKQKTERKRSAAERRQESDDEVRSNIDAELVPIWEAVRRRVRAVPGRSRTESFIHWVEENPDEVWRLREKDAEHRLAALLREEQRAAKHAGRKPGVRRARTRPTDEELRAVPF